MRRWLTASGKRDRLVRLGLPGIMLAAGVLLAGCSLRTMAMKNVSGVFDSAMEAYSTESDPELVKEALPSTLMIIKALVVNSPDNPGLLTTAASAYTLYAHAFVMEEADRVGVTDVARARTMRNRGKQLYLRARDYGLQGLEAKYPGFQAGLKDAPDQTLQQTTAEDVPLLYWTAAAWASALSVNAQDYSLLADLPVIRKMIHRALDLNEAWGDGRLHEFMISFEAGGAGGAGGSMEQAEQHFQRALELNHGHSAGTYVTAAEALAVKTQDKERFQSLLQKALAIDVDQYPDMRLANVLAQQRARWLLIHMDAYFY